MEKAVSEHSKPRLAYLCLQATREGQASYAHVHEIIAGLRRRGWEVMLFEPPYGKSGSLPGPIGRMLWFAIVQLRMFRSRKPNIIYIRNHFASLPTGLWARLCRIPVVQEVNGPYEDLFIAWPLTRYTAWLFKWCIRTQLRWADAIITVTPELADWAKQESGKTSVWVVPNGANTSLFRPDAPLPRGLVLPEKFVVFFGALAPWQGIDIMIEATRQLEWPSEVKLVIMGDGVERSKVEVAAREGRIIYYGIIPYNQLPGIVARSLGGLSPQNSLGERGKTGLSPLKVMETLACGVPAIVTDFPYMAQLVRENRCGIVIPPDDPKALAKAVRFLYEHPNERAEMGRRGREVVVREHSWEHRVELTEKILLHTLRLRPWTNLQ